jgi:hypothetical protein
VNRWKIVTPVLALLVAVGMCLSVSVVGIRARGFIYHPRPTPTATPTPTPAPAPTPTATPTPTPTPSGGMLVGTGNGCCGDYAELYPYLDGLVTTVRTDTDSASDIGLWAASGIKVINDISGDIGVPGYGSGGQQHYDTGGVIAINASEWADNAVAWYSSLTPVARVDVVAIEVLNEPYGSWFWGPNAESETNAAAYVNLLKTVHAAFLAAFPAGNYPLLLASWGDSTWGPEVWGSNPTIVNSYVNGVVVHPYGGTGVSQAQSALGNRALVTEAHTATGLPVYVTEVGWPTAVGQPATGDSMQWTETQQATNIYNFVVWARSQGYVNAVTIFSLIDSPSPDRYGGVRASGETAGASGTLKPGWYALQAAAQGLPLPPGD